MKSKAIKRVIRQKFDPWVESITDEPTRDLVKKNAILTGGAIANMLLREPVNDFDFYMRTHEAASAVAWYYVNKFRETPAGQKIVNDSRQGQFGVVTKDDHVRIVIKSSGVASESSNGDYHYFESTAAGEADMFVDDALAVKDAPEVAKDKAEKPDFRPVFLSENAISLSGDVQIVIRFFGEPDEIHKNYDFAHATNYWTSWDDKLVLRADALECLLTKELRYIGSRYPICSLCRIRKFIARQFTINAGQLLKIAMQIHELDLKNPEVLREQLIGMDMAYFMEVLSKLKEKNPEKIDTAYLAEIIDRIF